MNILSGTNFFDEDPDSMPAFITSTVQAYLYFLQDTAHDINVNALNLAAYQKIWREYYRDTIIDDDPCYLQGSSLDEITFNRTWDVVNKITDNDKLNLYLNNSFQTCMLKPRLHTYKKDLNTGLWSSFNYDISNLSDTNPYPTLNDVQEEYIEKLVPAANNNPPSAYAVKYVLAMQKYAESLMRAGSRTKDLLM